MKKEKLIKDIIIDIYGEVDDGKTAAYNEMEYTSGIIEDRVENKINEKDTHKIYESVNKLLWSNILVDNEIYYLTEEQFENIIDNIIDILLLKQVANKNMEKEMYDYEEY